MTPTQSQFAEPNHPEPSGGDHGSAGLLSPPTVTEGVPKGYTRPAHLPRPRINSLVGPAASSASPLALLFQPIVVEEDVIAEDDEEDIPSSVRPQNILSYGPASRRRLVSIGPRRRGRTAADTSPAISAMSRSQDMRHVSYSPTKSDIGDQFSTSPDQIRVDPSTSSVQETAGQILEEEEREGGESGLTRRLEIIEERQKRIEEMLVRLTQHLS